MARIIIGMLVVGIFCSACATGFAEGQAAATEWNATGSDDSGRQAANMQAEWAQQQEQASDDAWNAQQEALNQQTEQEINSTSQSILQPATPTFP
jgi:hypothetical protein